MCDELVVVLAPGAPEPSLPVDVVARFARDALEAQGPLVGAAAGLAATRTDLAILAGGDMPELRAAVLREMVRVASVVPVEAVGLRDGDRVRPLPILVRVERAAELADDLLRSGHRRLRDLLDELRVEAFDEATWVALDPGRRTLLDVDEPGDLPD